MLQKICAMSKEEIVSFLEDNKRCRVYRIDRDTIQLCEELCREQILSVSVLPLPNDNSNSTYYELRPGYKGREAYKKYVRPLKGL